MVQPTNIRGKFELRNVDLDSLQKKLLEKTPGFLHTDWCYDHPNSSDRIPMSWMGEFLDGYQVYKCVVHGIDDHSLQCIKDIYGSTEGIDTQCTGGDLFFVNIYDCIDHYFYDTLVPEDIASVVPAYKAWVQAIKTYPVEGTSIIREDFDDEILYMATHGKHNLILNLMKDHDHFDAVVNYVELSVAPYGLDVLDSKKEE